MKQSAADAEVRGAGPVVFACIFALSYFIFWGTNIALFSYYPQINVWVWGSAKATADSGPPMLFWGWMGYAALVASAATVLTRMLPPSWRAWGDQRLNWLVVGVPVAVIAGIIYLSRHWF